MRSENVAKNCRKCCQIARAESCVDFNTGADIVLPDNSIFTARAMLALQALY